MYIHGIQAKRQTAAQQNTSAAVVHTVHHAEPVRSPFVTGDGGAVRGEAPPAEALSGQGLCGSEAAAACRPDPLLTGKHVRSKDRVRFGCPDAAPLRLDRDNVRGDVYDAGSARGFAEVRGQGIAAAGDAAAACGAGS
ncbi:MULTISPECIES: hypothetical protein [Paenibacillus]|uniref:hypothetical protein n=1 Tax=Paenibacillus TaxID=44249 RepID=UPI0022B858E8|nr:hypothetical protein [Paenibacillus caseinilyticus]MCZ8521123.1 hypothetical protein [Paenibacillus caseinilyticus]